MEHDLVQFRDVEQAVAANGGVLRRDGLERAPSRSPEKMMWTTCFAAKLRTGAIESTIATGPSTGISSSTPTSSASSRWRARTRLSPEFTPPPGRSQYSRSVLLVPAEKDASAPAQDRRDADAGLGRHHDVRRAEAAHASLALRKLLDLRRLDLASGKTTS